MDLLLSSSKNYEDDSGLDQSCTGFEEDSVVKESNIETELCFLENGMNWTAVGGKFYKLLFWVYESVYGVIYSFSGV